MGGPGGAAGTNGVPGVFGGAGDNGDKGMFMPCGRPFMMQARRVLVEVLELLGPQDKLLLPEIRVHLAHQALTVPMAWLGLLELRGWLAIKAHPEPTALLEWLESRAQPERLVTRVPVVCHSSVQ
jgi:hypothetical protein